MKKSTLTIATRESPLALWQARFIKAALERLHPGLYVTLLGLTTEGDRFLAKPLYTIGGKGLFVKELETALLEDKADIAVHSLKDVPAQLPPGLILGAYCEREDPRDALVSMHYSNVMELPQGATVGSSSLRRQCQIKALRPDLNMVALRGNVDSRVAKLDRGEFAAILLAAAGLKRLHLEARVQHYFSSMECLPAIGQGVMAIECRAEDPIIQTLIAPLDHTPTRLCASAERAFNLRLGGGCHTPVAGFALPHAGGLLLKGLVGTPDGRTIIRASQTGSLASPQALGLAVAEELLAQGAGEILGGY